MLGAGWMNVASLAFGLLALALPVVRLVHRRENGAELSVASMTACAIAMCLQLFYVRHKVGINDLSAIMDTANAMALVAAALLLATILLNIVALVICSRKR